MNWWRKLHGGTPACALTGAAMLCKDLLPLFPMNQKVHQMEAFGALLEETPQLRPPLHRKEFTPAPYPAWGEVPRNHVSRVDYYAWYIDKLMEYSVAYRLSGLQSFGEARVHGTDHGIRSDTTRSPRGEPSFSCYIGSIDCIPEESGFAVV